MSGIVCEGYSIDYQVVSDDPSQKEETDLARFRRGISEIAYWGNSFGIEQCDYYQRSYLYFLVDGNYLKCLGTEFKINCATEAGVDLHMYDQSNQEVIESFYKLTPDRYSVFRDIYIYLRDKKFTDYYKALMAFKWRAGLLQFPLFDQKDFLKVINGRLLGRLWDDEHKTYIWKLLTEQIVAQEIKRWYGKDVRAKTLNADDKRKFDNAAKRLVKLAIAYHGEEQKTDEDKSGFEVPFTWGTIRYIPVTNQMEITYSENGWPWKQHIPRNPVLSDEVKDSLRTLTGGNIEILNDIAELMARLYLPERPSEYLWVVLGERVDVSRFIQWIYGIAELDGNSVGMAVYHASEKDRVLKLLYDQYLGCRVQINETFLDRGAFKKMHHVLEKFVVGDVVGELNDPYIPIGTVKGKGVIIYTSQEGYFDAPKNIPLKVIRVPQGWYFNGDINNDADIRWLQSYLLALGYQIILRGGFGLRREKKTVSEVLKEFIEVFCVSKDGGWIERKNSIICLRNTAVCATI